MTEENGNSVIAIEPPSAPEPSPPKKPFTDFSNQFNQARLVEDGIDTIYKALRKLADKCFKEKRPFGFLVVFGIFDTQEGKVFGVTQMGPNPIVNYTTIYDDDFEDLLLNTISQEDGALLVNRTGQLIGARIYLEVMHPDIAQEDDYGTRHRAAASFSMRPDILSVFTLSEETLKLRRWQGGKVVDTYEPAAVESKKRVIKAKTKPKNNNITE